MLKIRFLRTGRKKQPFYKIVVTDKNNPPKSGRFKEIVGFYNPLTKEYKIEKDKVLSWIEKGAQPTVVVNNLLIKKGIVKGKKQEAVSITNKRKEKIEAKAKEEKKEEVVEKTVEEVVEETAEETEKTEA